MVNTIVLSLLLAAAVFLLVSRNRGVSRAAVAAGVMAAIGVGSGIAVNIAKQEKQRKAAEAKQKRDQARQDAEQKRAPPTDETSLLGQRPIQVLGNGFVSSQKCQECHPDQHASWRASYHRTMTQVATPQTVIGDFDDVKLKVKGASYHLQRRADQFWVTMDNPDAGPGRPNAIQRPIVMTTGSHHMQVYW